MRRWLDSYKVKLLGHESVDQSLHLWRECTMTIVQQLSNLKESLIFVVWTSQVRSESSSLSSKFFYMMHKNASRLYPWHGTLAFAFCFQKIIWMIIEKNYDKDLKQ